MREGDTAYLCVLWDDEHHTMSLTEGDRGVVDHTGFRAPDAESVAACAERVEAVEQGVWWTDEGHERDR